MPIGVALALVAPDLVALLYGAAWREAGWVLGLLFLCLPAWACWGMTTPVLWNTGRKHLEARLQWPLLILAVPAWWLLTPFGLTAAAIVTVVMVYARSGVIVAAGLRALDARALTLLPLAGRGAGVSLGCGLAVVAAQAGVSLLSLPPTVQAAVALATGSIAALATGLLIAWALPELLGEDARQLLARVLPSMRSPDVAPPVATPGHP
jgi:O-antigen/teichoic acid export membrane protein